MDLPIVLHKDALLPLHKQLTDALRTAITSGRLAPKQPLPSSRELAESLAVARRTIIRSYNDLISQGYVETKSGGGTFVSAAPPVDSIAQHIQPDAKCINGDALSDFTQQVLRKEGTVDFANFFRLNFCAPPSDMLPAKQWRQSLSKYLAGNESEQLDYVVDIFGYRPLREQICRFLRHSKALQCTADQVIAFSDTFTGLDLIARAFINAGDTVVVEEPGYSYARQLFKAYGANVISVPIDENGLIVDELLKIEERCKLILVTPSHQDPTGAIMPLERRKALLKWAKENCDFVVEDGFDSDYTYSTPPLPSLHALDQSGRVLYLYSFWKILYPLEATGYLVVPPSLIEAFERTKQHVNRFFSIIEQSALADFIAEGHLERHWHKTRAIYKKRRQALIFALKQMFLNRVHFFSEGGGLHLTVRFDVPLSTDDIVACADDSDLPMMSTRSYYANEPVEREFLIPFCMIPEEKAYELVCKFSELTQLKAGCLRV